MLNALRKLKSRIRHAIDRIGYTPALTGPAEQRYLNQFARDEYTGRGEIVDLGCLLGATTIALARGLRNNRSVTNKKYRIHSFDIFLWDDWLNHYPGKPDIAYQPGDSFYPSFLHNIRGYTSYVAPYPYDLTKQGWIGGPIELLVSDASKTFDVCESVVNSFYPKLMRGQSVIFEQDFVHWYTPWLHLMNFRLRKSLKPLRYLPDSTTYLFQPVGDFDVDLVAADDLRRCTQAEVDEAFDHSLSLMPPGKGWANSSIMAAKVMFYAHTGQFDVAHCLLESCRADGYTFESDLGSVQSFLAANRQAIA